MVASPEIVRGPWHPPGMTRTVSRAAPTLPPVPLTPEQAAAIAVALAAQPDGPYAAAGHGGARQGPRGARARSRPPGVADRRAPCSSASEADRAARLRSVLEQGLAQHRVVVLAVPRRQGHRRPAGGGAAAARPHRRPRVPRRLVPGAATPCGGSGADRIEARRADRRARPAAQPGHVRRSPGRPAHPHPPRGPGAAAAGPRAPPPAGPAARRSRA